MTRPGTAPAEQRRDQSLDLDAESQLEALYRDAPVGLALLSPDMRFVRVNGWLAAMNGLSPEDHIGRTVWEVVPGIADSAVAIFERVFATGTSVLGHVLEGETAAEPGERRTWLEDYYPVKRPDGSVAYLGAIVSEITAERRAREALQRSEERFRVAQELSLDGFMTLAAAVPADGGGDEAPVDFRWTYVNPTACRLLKRPAATLQGRRLLEVLPGLGRQGDLLRRLRAVAATGAPMDVELRYEGDGLAAWFRIAAVRLADGLAVYFSDISARKNGEEMVSLMAHEVDHRAKNLIAVIQAIVQLAATDRPAEALKEALLGRIEALGRVHSALARRGGAGAGLEALVVEELEPYAGARLRVGGPTVVLKPRAAQIVALALHELATNAAKYGALASETGSGRLDVTWRHAAGLALRWEESGLTGVAPPERRGFGTRLIERTLGQLAGSAMLQWRPEGLCCTLTLPPDELVADALMAEP